MMSFSNPAFLCGFFNTTRGFQTQRVIFHYKLVGFALKMFFPDSKSWFYYSNCFFDRTFFSDFMMFRS